MRVNLSATANLPIDLTNRGNKFPVDGASSREQNVWFALYLAGCTALFWHPLRDLSVFAWSSDTDSHVLLIPFISSILLWLFRKVIFQKSRPSWRGFIALFSLGLFAYVPFWRFGSALPERYSLEIAILSLCCFLFAGFMLFYGAESFRAGLFPLLLLLLTAPLPGFLLDRLIWWLQLGSAEVTSWIFYLTHTPVLRQGMVFSVPGVTIEIAKECSGIRSTIGLMITCLLAGYLLLRTGAARVALLLAALPVLALKNGIRIATLTILSIHVDRGFLFGKLHRDGGFVFFAIGLFILLPVLLWLQKIESKRCTINDLPADIFGAR